MFDNINIKYLWLFLLLQLLTSRKSSRTIHVLIFFVSIYHAVQFNIFMICFSLFCIVEANFNTYNIFFIQVFKNASDITDHGLKDPHLHAVSRM